MTLSEEDLSHLRKFFNKYMYHILSRLLTCRDVSWDKSTQCLTISGKVLAKFYVYSRHVRVVEIAKKFRQNDNIVRIDRSYYITKTHNGESIVFMDADIADYMYPSKGRRASRKSRIDCVSYIYNTYVMIVF